MLFFIYSEDKDNSGELRACTRPQHLDYIKNFKILVGGPLLDDDDDKMTGTVMIVDLPDMNSAQLFAKADPYSKAGLFKNTTIKRWKKVKLMGDV
jgi:uncharacterized protein